MRDERRDGVWSGQNCIFEGVTGCFAGVGASERVAFGGEIKARVRWVFS
jgi:hypothetical protein